MFQEEEMSRAADRFEANVFLYLKSSDSFESNIILLNSVL